MYIHVYVHMYISVTHLASIMLGHIMGVVHNGD